MKFLTHKSILNDMIISSTVAILLTQIVGFLLLIAINALVTMLAYKLGTYDYKVSIEEGWYNYLVSYKSYQFSVSRRLLVLATFILLLLSHFYATIMSSGYSYDWSLSSLGPNQQLTNWSLVNTNLLPVAANIDYTITPWLTANIDSLNAITCSSIKGCGMGSQTSNFTLDNGAPIASENLPLSSWQHSGNVIGYNYSGVLLTPINLFSSNGASAVQSNSACYSESPLANFTYGGVVKLNGSLVNQNCLVDDYTGLVTLLVSETDTILYSLGAMSASLPGAVGRFSPMMVGVSQSFDVLSLYNNVTVAVLTTVKVSRGLSAGIFDNSSLSVTLSNIGDDEITNLWKSTGLYDAVITGNIISEESWSLTNEGLTGYFVIAGLKNSYSTYQTLSYNINIVQLNLSSSVPGATLNVFSNNVPDFTLMDDYTFSSQSTGINLTSACGLSCMQFTSITASGLMSLSSSLQNVIRAIIEGQGIMITSYSYVDGFLVPISWIVVNVLLVVCTMFFVLLMITRTPAHYKSTLRQVIINCVEDNTLTRAATELSIVKIDDSNNIGVAIDGKPIGTILPSKIDSESILLTRS
jgi:hypothetical protein